MQVWKKKGHYRKDCPNSAATSPRPDQYMQAQPYSPPTTVTQTITASYAVPQPSFETILKEFAMAKQTKQQLKKERVANPDKSRQHTTVSSVD